MAPRLVDAQQRDRCGTGMKLRLEHGYACDLRFTATGNFNRQFCLHTGFCQRVRFAPAPEGAAIPNKGPRRGPTSRWAQTANAIGSEAARAALSALREFIDKGPLLSPIASQDAPFRFAVAWLSPLPLHPHLVILVTFCSTLAMPSCWQ